jgi:predicted kinase
MMHTVSVRLPSGNVVQILDCSIFGRADIGPHADACNASRRQFSLQIIDKKVVVTSLSLVNPTKILRAPASTPINGPPSAELLTYGKRAGLDPGDRVLLLATDPSTAMELIGERTNGEEAGVLKESHRPSVASRSIPPSGQVVLILAGLQGAGKSTFSKRLVEAGPPGKWTRVNQDTAGAGGRRGTREDCLVAAREALRRGGSIVVDRTNADEWQRAHFIRLAVEEGAAPHCVFLDLPAKACAARAAARTDHEGGLQVQ